MPLWINLKGEPPAIDEKLLQELGRSIMLWAWVEHALVHDIREMLRLSQNDPSFPRKPIPPLFTRRRKLWFEMCNALYASIPHYKANAEEINKALETLTEIRNPLIHGLLEGMKPQPDGSVRLIDMQSVPGKPDQVTLDEYKVDIPTLQAFCADLEKVHAALLSMQVNRMLGTHRLPTPQ